MHRCCFTLAEVSTVERRQFRLLSTWAWLCCLVFLTGCGGAGSESADRSSAHELPPHYPENLAAGVGRLRELWLQLHPNAGQVANSTGSDQVVAAGSDETLAKFADLVEWLPELAAASDLREADWRICREVSTELSQAVAPLFRLDQLTQQQRLKEIATLVEQGLQRLAPVVNEFERLEQRYRSAEDLTDSVGTSTDPVDHEE